MIEGRTAFPRGLWNLIFYTWSSNPHHIFKRPMLWDSEEMGVTCDQGDWSGIGVGIRYGKKSGEDSSERGGTKGLEQGSTRDKRDRKSGMIWNVVSERGYNISRLWEDWIMESLEGLPKVVDFTQRATRSNPPTPHAPGFLQKW